MTISTREYLEQLGDSIRGTFVRNRRVMSFSEYLELAARAPRIQLRSAPQYVVDCFDHYGTEEVAAPAGKVRRFKLFDCPWADGREALVGQEDVQNRVYRALCNFVNEGTANKLLLLHGPNGSAKSTFVRCIGRGLQHYSTLDEGALYRFNWIFPAQKVSRGGIGFGGNRGEAPVGVEDSYAYLPEELVDTRVPDELRDHPLLLIPVSRRGELLERLGAGLAETHPGFMLSDYLRFGRLSHKNRAVYEALLGTYQGDFLKVLRHVQVERFYVQQRYREGYVTVEPQLSVDARERQITVDRSIAALPAALQSVSLYEYGGEVINANRGLIEYSDLLKRPLETYKYLLTTVERASIALPNATLFLDLVFLGTSNEIHLDHFKRQADFQSFKGRLELVRVPYLLDYTREERLYQSRIREAAGARHVAPHCAYVAALWAVLTRMRKPRVLVGQGVRANELLAKLSPLDKAELYALGRAPDSMAPDEAKELLALRTALVRESEGLDGDYEGLFGASPREMLGVLFNAANSTVYEYVSPLAILQELEELIKQGSVYHFLTRKEEAGGYQAHAAFIQWVRERLIERTDDEVRSAMGLIEESEYERIFQRYVVHVMHWTKRERVANPATGRMEDPDAALMGEVEKTLEVTAQSEEFRRNLISKIGAWALDHPKERPDYQVIFADYFKRMKEAYFERSKKEIRRGIEDLLALLADDGVGLGDDARAGAQRTLDNLMERFGYRADSAREAVSLLFRKRYA